MSIDRLIAGEMNQWLNDELLWIPNWKWIALGIALCSGLLIYSLLQKILLRVKRSPRLRQHFGSFFKHSMETPIHRPAAWMVVSFLWLLFLYGLDLPERFEQNSQMLVKLILVLAAIRVAYCLAEALGRRFKDALASSDSPLDDSLVPFATKTIKVLVVVFGILIAMQTFGVNVMSLLAGLGLGGLALALAAQDTAANLFGSITIIFDKPFEVGDWIKVGDTEGIVEEVGFRSTRVRTFYRSMVTIPNSTMAKEKIDNLGVRPCRRLKHIFGLTYDASVEKIQRFRDRVREDVAKHPQVKTDEVVVNLVSLGDFSLNVQLTCYVYVTLEKSEGDIQEEILFLVMTAANEVGVEFAFPTATHHLKVPGSFLQPGASEKVSEKIF
jgi:MscS family membrane protein